MLLNYFLFGFNSYASICFNSLRLSSLPASHCWLNLITTTSTYTPVIRLIGRCFDSVSLVRSVLRFGVARSFGASIRCRSFVRYRSFIRCRSFVRYRSFIRYRSFVRYRSFIRCRSFVHYRSSVRSGRARQSSSRKVVGWSSSAACSGSTLRLLVRCTAKRYKLIVPMSGHCQYEKRVDARTCRMSKGLMRNRKETSEVGSVHIPAHDHKFCLLILSLA